uniref:Uncharacterized protein n=1 Tax=Nonomuraea gerenzanensis TaxID=93944 RepID=A0A1M4DVS2_9ACTN|nr:hypothetical protein BN4615_P182 [Nonomuraea gerenzanensis]
MIMPAGPRGPARSPRRPPPCPRAGPGRRRERGSSGDDRPRD